MSSHFVYRPHVGSGGKVYTPDLVIERAWISYGQSKVVAIPVDRLTTAAAIQQPGGSPHGIAALALVGAGDGPLLTVASLHSASFYAPALLACAKPLSRQAWRLRDVAPHLNRLRLRSWHLTGDERRPATEEPAGRIANFDALDDLPPERVLLFAARHAGRPHGKAEGFAVELEDPVRGETLSLSYTAENIE